MEPKATTIQYRRRRATGTLTLSGAVDIFEVQRLHGAAMRAMNDVKSEEVVLDITGMEQADLSILQVLISLRQSLEATGRVLRLSAIPGSIVQSLAQHDLEL